MNDSTPKQEPPYGLRMPPDLKDRVKSAASDNNRSMNAEIVATLEEKYPAPKLDTFDKIAKAFAQFQAAMASDKGLDAGIVNQNTRQKADNFLESIGDADIDVELDDSGDVVMRFKPKES